MRLVVRLVVPYPNDLLDYLVAPIFAFFAGWDCGFCSNSGGGAAVLTTLYFYLCFGPHVPALVWLRHLTLPGAVASAAMVEAGPVAVGARLSEALVVPVWAWVAWQAASEPQSHGHSPVGTFQAWSGRRAQHPEPTRPSTAS